MGNPGGYEWLASVLGELSAAGRARAGPRQRDGRRRAAELAGPDDPVDLLEDEMARRGFRPTRAMDGQRIRFALGQCPFAEVVAADPDTICRLHLGLAEGLADGLGGMVVERLTPRDSPAPAVI